MLAEEFLKRFLVSARVLNLDEGHIFFDRNRILAGEEWGPALEEGLARATLFVFLVSFDSLASGCCMQKELATAAQRAIPIVPIIVSPCDWKKQPVPGTPKTLDRFNPLPVAKQNEATDLLPVIKWPHRDEAWVVVNEALCKKLRSMVATRAVKGSVIAAPGGYHDIEQEILAYRCNQLDAVDDFRSGIQSWKGEQPKTLVVLTKGISEDGLDSFWSRLAFEFLLEKRKLVCRREVPVQLFVKEDGSRKEIQRLTRAQLNAAIDTATSSTIESPTHASACITPVVAYLHSGKEPGIAQTIAQTLLRTLEEHENPDVLPSLVMVIHVEDSTLHTLNLTRKWGLHKFSRTLVVELSPLEEIADGAVREWLRLLPENRDLEPWLRRLAQLRALAPNQQVRLRKFSQLVREMLA